MSSDPKYACPLASRRRALVVSISALCSEAGFGTAEHLAIESIAEMIQSFLTEVGRSAQAFTELSGRTEPTVTDVVMAMVDLGQDIQSLPDYAKKSQKKVILPPDHSIAAASPRTLQPSQKLPHPSYIPSHFPPFPEQHTYIKTPTHKPPVTEYQLIREKASTQRRDVERGLTRFIAKTGDTESLFKDDTASFPLIACRPKPQPYLDALLPKGLELEAADSEDASQQSNVRTSQTMEGVSAPILTSESIDMIENEALIDNPYLRVVTMPKLGNFSKKKTKY